MKPSNSSSMLQATSSKPKRTFSQQETPFATPLDSAQNKATKQAATPPEIAPMTPESHSLCELESANADELTNGKHHPVMGIFFKVWSLVKVTKMRSHHNAAASRADDSASQFRYISGDQLQRVAVAADFSQQRTHFLHDGHFRRAGSQPAPASRASDSLGRQSSSASRRQLLLATSGTNSTSSGVSSSTSHSQASNSATPATCQVPPAPPPPPPPPPLASQPSFWWRHSKQNSSSSSHKSGGWTSRVRRSATSVMNSEASKYRIGRHNTNDAVARSPAPKSRLQRQDKPKLAAIHQPKPQFPKQHPNLRLSTPIQRHSSECETSATSGGSTFAQNFLSSSINNNNNTIINNNDLSDEDDSQNDIYSTPNDSIQSVPSSINGKQSQHQVAPLGGGQMYPMVKSFSAHSFKQLATSQQNSSSAGIQLSQNVGNGHRFKPIDEMSATETQIGNQVQDVINPNLFQHQDSSESSNKSISQRRLNGSRFFISSSSSEDSTNSPHNQQQQQQHRRPKQPPQQQHLDTPPSQLLIQQQQQSLQLEQHQPRVELQHGIHYHEQQQTPNHLISPVNYAPDLQLGRQMQPAAMQQLLHNSNHSIAGYKKSPSLFEFSAASRRFSSKYPAGAIPSLAHQRPSIAATSSFRPSICLPATVAPPGDGQLSRVAPRDSDADQQQQQVSARPSLGIPNSISLYDCKIPGDSSAISSNGKFMYPQVVDISAAPVHTSDARSSSSEYKLTRMLLESGANSGAKDTSGFTALMHAVLSDNLSAVKCLVEHRVDLDATNNEGLTALDLICSREPSETRLAILRFLIESRANLDHTHHSDGSRLLDRLIGEHGIYSNNRLPYIECLLQSGAKLGSSTWMAAHGKHDIQLRLLKKLCQDGYFLYKKSSIEAAVYRFEYALRRIAGLEQQLAYAPAASNFTNSNCLLLLGAESQPPATRPMVRQLKYQTYLGLSRCERKRRFYKRALEFAHLAILVDSNSYEGFYSKAHILKDLGEYDDSLLAIDQTSRLVDKSIESLQTQLEDLQQLEDESLILDRCFNIQLPKPRAAQVGADSTKQELVNTLEYLAEAKRHIENLRGEIIDDKLKAAAATAESESEAKPQDQEPERQQQQQQRQEISSAGANLIAA